MNEIEKTIKILTTKISEKDRIISGLQDQITDMQKLISKERKDISVLNKEIHQLTNNSELVISEHAILRLLERRYGQADMIEKVVQQTKEEFKGLPVNCKKKTEDGFEVVIVNNLMVTIK